MNAFITNRKKKLSKIITEVESSEKLDKNKMDVAALLAEKKRVLGHHVEYLRETVEKVKMKSDGSNDKSVQQFMQLLDVVTSDRKVLTKNQIEMTNKLISEKRWPGLSRNQDGNVTNDSSRDLSRVHNPSKDDSHAPGSSHVSRDPRLQRSHQARESSGTPFEAHNSQSRNDRSMGGRSEGQRFRNSPDKMSRSPSRFRSSSPSFFNRSRSPSRSRSRPRFPENSGHKPERPNWMSGNVSRGHRSDSQGRSLARVTPDDQFNGLPASNEFKNTGRHYWVPGSHDHAHQSHQTQHSGRPAQFKNSRNFPTNSNEDQSMRFHNTTTSNTYDDQRWQQAKTYGEHAPVQIQLHVNSYNQRRPSMHPENVERHQSPTIVAHIDPRISHQSRDPRLNRPVDSHQMQIGSSVGATIDFGTKNFNSGSYRDNFQNSDRPVETRPEKQFHVAPRRRLSCHEMQPQQVPPVTKMKRRMSVHHTAQPQLTKDVLSSPRFQMPKKTVAKSMHASITKNEKPDCGNVRKKARLSSLESTGSFSMSSDNSVNSKGSVSSFSSYKIPKKNQQPEQAQSSSSADQKPILEFEVIETVKNFVENVVPKNADKPEDLVKKMEKALGTENFMKFKSLLVNDTIDLPSSKKSSEKVAEASKTETDVKDVCEVKESKAKPKLKRIEKIEITKPYEKAVTEGKLKVKESEKKIEKLKVNAEEPKRKQTRLSIASKLTPEANSKVSHSKVSSKSVGTKKLDAQPIEIVKNQFQTTKSAVKAPLSSSDVLEEVHIVPTISSKVALETTQASEIKHSTTFKVKKYKSELDRLQDYNNDSVDLRDGVMKAYLPRVCTKAKDARDSAIFKKYDLKKVAIVVEPLHFDAVPMPVLLTEEFAKKYPQLKRIIKPYIRKPNTKSLAELLQQDEEDENDFDSSGATLENVEYTPPAAVPTVGEELKPKPKTRKSRRNLSWSRGVIAKTPTKKKNAKVQAVEVNSEDEWEDVATEEPSKKERSQRASSFANIKFTKFVKLMDNCAAKFKPQTETVIDRPKLLEPSQSVMTLPPAVSFDSKPVANLVQFNQVTTTIVKSENFEIKTGPTQQGANVEVFMCRIARCCFFTYTSHAFNNHIRMLHSEVFWNRECSLCKQKINAAHNSMQSEFLHYLTKHQKVESKTTPLANTPIETPAKTSKPAAKPVVQDLIEEKTAKIIKVSGKSFKVMLPTTMVTAPKTVPDVTKTSTSFPTDAVKVVAEIAPAKALIEIQSTFSEKQQELQDKTDQNIPTIKIRSLPGDKLSTPSASNTLPIQSLTESLEPEVVASLSDNPRKAFVIPKLLPQQTRPLPSTSATSEVAKVVKAAYSSSIRPWFNRIEQKSNAIRRNMLMNTKCLAALFKCMGSTCSFYTNNREIFEMHIGIHENLQVEDKENFLMCSYCEEKETDSKTLVEHVFNVHGSNKFQCGYCFYRAHVGFYVTDLHQKKCHEGQKKMLIECEPLKPLDLGEERQRLKKFHHFVPPFVCIHCSKPFYLTERFITHLKTHSTEKSMRCVKCQQVMNAESVLQHHFICHGFGECQCIYCKHGTKDAQEMEKHLFENHPDNVPRFCTRKEKSENQNDSMDKSNVFLLIKSMVYKPATSVIPIKHSSEELKNEENVRNISASSIIIDPNNYQERGLNEPNDFLKIGNVFSLSESRGISNMFDEPFDDDFFTDFNL